MLPLETLSYLYLVALVFYKILDNQPHDHYSMESCLLVKQYFPTLYTYPNIVYEINVCIFLL